MDDWHPDHATVTGARLREAREAVGLSLSALATRTHFSKSLLGQLETGERRIRTEHVRAYSDALGIGSILFLEPADGEEAAAEGCNDSQRRTLAATLSSAWNWP